MRFYAMGNMYLSSIQQGIQAGHALGEIVVKYEYGASRNPTEQNVVKDFLTNHKTWILLNGGTWEEIATFAHFLGVASQLKYPVPFAPFYEDAKSLGGIMTCVGFILPKEYYEAKSYKTLGEDVLRKIAPVSEEDYFYFDEDTAMTIVFAKGTQDWELISQVKNCSLAR